MIGAIPDSAAEIRARGGVQTLDQGNEPETMDPDDIAPFVCYLASDYAANINGQTFLVYSSEISLMSQPRPERSIYNEGHWSMEEIAAQSRNHLTRGIYNPAPPRA